MKNVFDFETAKIEVTGAWPLIDNVYFLFFKVLKRNEEMRKVDGNKRTWLIAKLTQVLDGPKPEKSDILDIVIEALDSLYDETNIDVVLTSEEDDAFIEYLAWLKGGLPCDGDIVPFAKPDKNDLMEVSVAIYKMVHARAIKE